MSKAILAILDGFGINTENPSENAILQANAPTLHALFTKPHAKLDASGLAVGIPDGQMGNSEVGHMTIGAGRTILQGTVKIDVALSNGSFATLPEFRETFSHLKNTHGSLHLFTLFGSGGVHASQIHLEKALATVPSDVQVFLHLFTDGRDLPPTSALELLKSFQSETLAKHSNVQIASLAGRYFAMDRDNNYSRIEGTYHAIVGNTTPVAKTAEEIIAEVYAAGKTDEFVEPVLLSADGAVKSGDAVWFLNFRSDRARMMTEAFCEAEFPHFDRKTLENLHFVSMVPYYQGYRGASFFRDENVTDTLGEVLSKQGIQQLRIAETEKFAHVTKFFNGGRFEPFEKEDQKLIPSHKVATYDLDPAMSADEITDIIVSEGSKYPAIIVNYANGDMVGHTGMLDAAAKAVETLDRNVARLIDFARKNDYEILLTADHGNCEEMGSPDAPKTSHTTNFVPCWHIVNGEAVALKKEIGTLANLAPSMLSILGIEKPAAMIESLV